MIHSKSHSQLALIRDPGLPSPSICPLNLPPSSLQFFSHKTEAYPSNVAASGSNTTHSNTNSPSRLGNQCTLLYSVINAFKTIIFHTQKETPMREEKVTTQQRNEIKQRNKTDYTPQKQ